MMRWRWRRRGLRDVSCRCSEMPIREAEFQVCHHWAKLTHRSRTPGSTWLYVLIVVYQSLRAIKTLLLLTGKSYLPTIQPLDSSITATTKFANLSTQSTNNSDFKSLIKLNDVANKRGWENTASIKPEDNLKKTDKETENSCRVFEPSTIKN